MNLYERMCDLMFNRRHKYQEKCLPSREVDSNWYNELIPYQNDRSWVVFLVMWSWATYYTPVSLCIKWGNLYYGSYGLNTEASIMIGFHSAWCSEAWRENPGSQSGIEVSYHLLALPVPMSLRSSSHTNTRPQGRSVEMKINIFCFCPIQHSTV